MIACEKCAGQATTHTARGPMGATTAYDYCKSCGWITAPYVVSS